MQPFSRILPLLGIVLLCSTPLGATSSNTDVTDHQAGTPSPPASQTLPALQGPAVRKDPFR
jgi:hypothetical protein